MNALEHHLGLPPDQLEPENLKLYRRVCGKPLKLEHVRRAARALERFFGQRWRPLVEECTRLGLDPSGALSPKYLPELPESEMVWVIILMTSWLDDFDQDAAFTVAQGVLTALRYGFPPTRLAFMLRRQLRHAEGFERDWRGIAITASHLLAGTGKLSTVPDRSYVLGQSYNEACEDCRRLVHGRMFQKIEPPEHPTNEQRQHAIWIGKSNHDLEREDWRACIVLHAECRCWFSPLNPEHWWISDDGRMRPRAGQEAAYGRWRDSQWFEAGQKNDALSETSAEPSISGQPQADRSKEQDHGGRVTEPSNDPSHVSAEQGEMQQPPGEAEQLHRDLSHGLIDCLDHPTEIEGESEERDRRERLKTQLAVKLRELGIEGELSQIVVGPVFARFEFRPAPGVTIEHIRRHMADIERAVGSKVVFRSAVLGSLAVAFDIANLKRRTVWLRDLMPSEGPPSFASMPRIPVGVDIAGVPFFVDLREHPNMFILGAKGTGKSSLLHAMVAAIMCKASPLDVRFLMFDTNQGGLSDYDPSPHMLFPTVVNAGGAPERLDYVLKVMNERSDAFSHVGAHDFQDFNDRTHLNHSEAKPRLLVVVDDITCLLGSSAKDIESRMSEVLLRGDDLGVHLVVTSTPPLPSAIDHWTKDDFTCRVAFWLRDHREINRLLDTGVADTLLPYGDMMVATAPDSDNLPGLLRVHAPWVSRDARLRIVQRSVATGSKPA